MGCTTSRKAPPPRTYNTRKSFTSQKSDVSRPSRSPARQSKPPVKEEVKVLIPVNDDDEVKTEEGIDSNVKIKRDDLFVSIET